MTENVCNQTVLCPLQRRYVRLSDAVTMGDALNTPSFSDCFSLEIYPVMLNSGRSLPLEVA